MPQTVAFCQQSLRQGSHADTVCEVLNDDSVHIGSLEWKLMCRYEILKILRMQLQTSCMSSHQHDTAKAMKKSVNINVRQCDMLDNVMKLDYKRFTMNDQKEKGQQHKQNSIQNGS
ncbi:hypothetical protein OSTOST_17942 [Ostertagia ostertagi]